MWQPSSHPKIAGPVNGGIVAIHLAAPKQSRDIEKLVSLKVEIVSGPDDVLVAVQDTRDVGWDPTLRP